MREIKIGDIVAPTSIMRRKELNKGIVVAVKQPARYPTVVVFPSSEQLFTVWDFTEPRLNVVDCTEQERKEIVEAVYNYRQMQIDISHV